MIPPALIKYGVMAAIVLGLGLRYYYVTNQLELALSENKTLETTIAMKINVITEQEASMETLRASIETLNKENASYEKQYKSAKSTLEKWRSKPPEVKYVTINKAVNPNKKNYSRASCDDGLRLNKHISELSYDSL